MNTLFIVTYLTMMAYSYIIYKVVKNVKILPMAKKPLVEFKQSSIHEMIKDFLPSNAQIVKMSKAARPLLKQSGQRYQEGKVKVVVVGNMAYWIQENAFYQTEITEDGEINSSNAKPIDTSNLSENDLNHLLRILDDLRSDEGNDGRSSRDE